jgi:hypothetical protein
MQVMVYERGEIGLFASRIAVNSGRRLAVMVIATLCVFELWVGIEVGGEGATRYLDDIATAVAAALAAVTCLLTTRRRAGGSRRFWLLMGAAGVAWTFGEAAWAWYDLVLGVDVPVLSYADIGYLGAIPLAIAALVTGTGTATREVKARAGIDALILATALLFVSWTFVLGPLWRQNDMTTGAGLVTIGYPFGDILIVFLLIRALHSLTGPDRIALGWILAGLLAMSIADSSYTYLTAERGYSTGNLMDVGWVAAYLFIAVGAWHARDNSATVELRTGVETVAGMLTPYLALLLALVVLTIKAQLGMVIDRASLALAFALVGSVLFRQALTAFARERS